MKKLLDFSPETGVAHHFILDEHSGDARIVATQDATPLIEFNKLQFNEPVKKRTEWRKVASLDLGTWMALRKIGIIGDQKAFKRWLNDPDNRAFRTSPERV